MKQPEPTLLIKLVEGPGREPEAIPKSTEIDQAPLLYRGWVGTPPDPSF